MPPESEARAWWGDVQHVREPTARRGARAVGSSAGADADVEMRFAHASESLPVMEDLDWTPAYSGADFDRAGGAARSDRPRGRTRGADDAHGFDRDHAGDDHARDRGDRGGRAGDRRDGADYDRAGD